MDGAAAAVPSESGREGEVVAAAGSGRCSFVVCGNLFEVDPRYVPIKPIGKGAYGVVWRAPRAAIFHVFCAASNP